jgi:hypothetical protein
LSAGLNKKERGWKKASERGKSEKATERQVSKTKTPKEAKSYPDVTGICLPL